MDHFDDAIARLNAKRSDNDASKMQRHWGNDQAQEIVRRYVRSLQRAGVAPLGVDALSFTREDWNERRGGMFSRQTVSRHRWVATAQPAGEMWLVAPVTGATLRPGNWHPGDDGPGPEVRVPVVVLFDPVTDKLASAVLLSQPGFELSDIQGEMFRQVRAARTASVKPTIVGDVCDYIHSCRGACGYPLWLDAVKFADPFTSLGVRGVWYEDLPRGGFTEHSVPAGQGFDAFDHYTRPLFENLDHQLRQLGLTWT